LQRNGIQPAARCRLYLISPPVIDAGFGDRLEDAIAGGDIACLQLRLKDADDATIMETAASLLPITRANDIALLINDRPDIAARSGADGVHIGQDDASYSDARATVGPDAIVGVTCHNSRHLAMEAADAGADYVAFGAFFDSATKTPKYRADVPLLEWWSSLIEVPCVAIGGITADNCAPLVKAGADFLAVVSAVWDHPEGPGAGVRALNAEITRALSR
jgi:thiamine-phosphate pyrophosphorylase